MVEGKKFAAIAMLILFTALVMGCGGSAPYDDFVAKLESENIDPTHYVVNVALRALCEAHAETGFMEKYYAERKFIRASNDKTVPLYHRYNEDDTKVLTATTLAMKATVDGGTQMKIFCESLGFG